MRLTATGIVKTTSSARRIRCGVATTQNKHHKVRGNRVGCYQFCIYQRILAARLGYRKYKKKNSQPDSTEDKLPLTIRHVSTATWTVDGAT